MQARNALASSGILTLFLVFASLSWGFVFGQSPETISQPLLFDRLNQVNELSNQTITSIVQDDLGFMWFGSVNGLMRFDGYQIKVFRHDSKIEKSLANNSIQAITKDNRGNLWIATEGAGLECFNLATETFSHYHHDPTDPSSISGNSLVSVFVDSEGKVWMGTYSNGLNCLDPSTGKFIRITEERYLPIRAIAEDEAGNIWFSSNGLNRVDRKRLTVTRYPAKVNDPSAIKTGGIRSILFASNKTIWIGTHDEDGLFQFDVKESRFIPTPLYGDQKASVYALYEDVQKQIWMGTSKGVAVLYENKIRHYLPDACNQFSIKSKVILSVYADQDGNIWLAGENGGVNKTLPPKKFQKFFFPDATALLTRNGIRSLCEDYKGNIWIGWVEGGIDIVNPEKKTVVRFPISTKDDINCIYEDNDSSIWIGTWDAGLFHYSGTGELIQKYLNEGNANSLPDNRVQAIHRDRFGVLWVATENGLSQLDVVTKTWTAFKKPDFPSEILGNNIQSLAFIEAPDGTLWVGTWSGLSRISPDRKSVKHYISTDQYHSINDHVVSLYLDAASEQLWIGTYEGGLRKLDLKTETITYFDEDNGLSSGTIFGILPDHAGRLWLSTRKGLSMLDVSTSVFRNYDETDGLQSEEFFWGGALKTKSGKLIMSGLGSINLFDPRAIRLNEKIPNVVLTDFEIFNKAVPIEEGSVLNKSIGYVDEITIPYDQSVLTFEFASLNYVNPEKSQYAYQLQGFDKEWNYVKDKRDVTYTNLEPGSYTFSVKASNNDGIWNNTGKSIRIIITPPFWLTWWFKSLGAVMIMSGLVLFYKIRMNVAKKRQLELELQVKERTQEIITKNNEILEQMRRVENLNNEIATQRDNIEQQNNLLAAAKTDLEQKVKERTHELSQTNQELMEQNVQLEQFAFMTAHNLRAPVARLLGLTSIFNTQDRTDPLNWEIIKRIQISASGLDEVIRDISDILQVKKGIQRNIEAMEILPAINKAQQALRHEIAEKEMVINNAVPENLLIKGIPPYVHSVFYNIISNAVKYADFRKRSFINISATSIGEWVTVDFLDNGIGFDSIKQKDKLFKPFSRLSSNGDGKGLGLFLVKIQMESMNGEIEIASEIDKGTKVKLRFKAA